jgi:hypothetical protein
MCYLRVLLFSIALELIILASCSGLSGEAGPNKSKNGGDAGVTSAAGSSNDENVAEVDSGGEADQGEGGSATDTAGTGGVGGTAASAGGSGNDSAVCDAGAVESGAADSDVDNAVEAEDASSVVTEGGVQPPLRTGGCCEEHEEPGCDDAETQACVCERLPDCCTATWDLPCTLIVIQKYCEPGVRECVCGPASDGGWEQTQCCETEWTNFCDETAIIKCGAKAGC